MKLSLRGAGLWTRGLESFAQLDQRLSAEFANYADATFVVPKPEAISARERRRSGLLINLAVMAAHQACEHAQVDKSQVPSVFASAMGDTALTDYMCRKLNQPDKLLSPTKFHNSVHNAPAGYWSISAENRAPSTFVGGFLQSFGAGLFEASSLVVATGGPVLLVAYDIANAAPFHDLAPISESMGLALVLAPADAGAVTTGQSPRSLPMSLSYAVAAEDQSSKSGATAPQQPTLAELAKTNPVGDGLALLECFAHHQHEALSDIRLCIPAAPEGALNLRLGNNL